MKYPKTLLFIASLLLSWLWFRPVFWNMTELNDFWAGFLDIFFLPSEPEYMLGAGIDQLGTFWIFAQLPEIWRNSSSVLPMIYYPTGWDLGQHTGFAWLDGILTLPLQYFFGVPYFYNLHIVLTLSLSIWGIALLGHQSKLPPLLSLTIAYLGFFHSFSYVEVGMGRPTQVFWLFSCLFLYSLLQFQEKKTLAWMTGIALSLVGSCFVYWFGGVAVGFCGGIVYLFDGLLNKKKFSRLGFALYGALLSLGLALLFTWRISSLMLQGQGGDLFPALQKTPIMVLDYGFSIPIHHRIVVHSLSQFQTLFEQVHGSWLLGYLALFSIMVPFGWKKRLPWFIGWAFSLGIPLTGLLEYKESMFITGQTWLQLLFPPLLRNENPERMLIAPTLFSAVLVILLLSNLKKNHLLSVIIALLFLGTAKQSPPSSAELQVSSFVQDEFLLEITQEYSGGIIDIPLSRSENNYVQQLFHHQPVLGGPGLNRVQPKEHLNYYQKNSFFQALETWANTGNSPSPWKQKDLDILINDGFSIVLFDPHNSKMTAQELELFLGVKGIKHRRTKRMAFSLKDIQKVQAVPPP